MRTDELLPRGGDLVFRSWGNAMTLEDVADRLDTDRVSPVGQYPDDPILAPGAILLFLSPTGIDNHRGISDNHGPSTVLRHGYLEKCLGAWLKLAGHRGCLAWLTSFSPVLPEAGNLFATVVAMTSVNSRFMRSMWMSLLRPRSENGLPLHWPTCMGSSICISPPFHAGRLLMCTSSTWTTARLSMSAHNTSPARNPLLLITMIASCTNLSAAMSVDI
jgi:hypothetical protein